MRPIPVGVTVVLLCFVSFWCRGETNDWTKPSSGSWEEPYWSLGRIPGQGQGTIAVRNPGWKAVAINAATRANFPESLRIDSLLIEGPTDSYNVLLLNYAGLEVPLEIDSELLLGTNASLISYYTAVRGGTLELSSPASFSEGSTAIFGNIVMAHKGAANST